GAPPSQFGGSERRRLGAGKVPGSAVEREPAQVVAQLLIVEHKLSDLVGELGPLPLALQTAGFHAAVFSGCRARRPDRVSRGTELVARHVAHRRGLTGSVRGMPWCPTQV